MSETVESAQGYQHYPLAMRHPAEAPAIPSGEPRWVTDPSTGSRHLENNRGQPARFPPVLVHTADDEEYYRAQGYEAAGNVSAQQFARMNTLAVAGTGGDFQEYPKWVDGVLVQSADEEAALKAPLDARQPGPAETSHAAPDRAEQAETGGADAIADRIATLRSNRASMASRIDEATRQIEQTRALIAQLEDAIAQTDAEIARLADPRPALTPDPRRRGKPGPKPGSKRRTAEQKAVAIPGLVQPPQPATPSRKRPGVGARSWATRRANEAARRAADAADKALD